MRKGLDFIGVGVGAIIRNENQQLFLSRRGPLARNENDLWEFPGGSVEFGETLAQALRREMLEEFQIEIEVGPLLDVVDHILPEEKQHWVSPTFICKISKGIPKIVETGKCSAIGWFSLGDIPNNLTKITRSNLQHFYRWLAEASPMYEMPKEINPPTSTQSFPDLSQSE